jgi:D-alanyl-D-alanine dipeptidase
MRLTKHLHTGIICGLALFAACRQHAPELPNTHSNLRDANLFDHQHEPLAKDMELEVAGLVDVSTLDEGIAVQLVYATPYNFLGKTLYKELTRAYLQPDAAQKLLAAYKALKQQRPDLTLLVYDAARPVSIQHEMWNLVKGTAWEYYVANPANDGGMHNRGVAVDLTLMDCTGQPLPMGTPFDYFGPEANTDDEAQLVKTGRITPRELGNRRLLRDVMTAAGFRTVRSEWWHFNACTAEEARQQYPLIE